MDDIIHSTLSINGTVFHTMYTLPFDNVYHAVKEIQSKLNDYTDVVQTLFPRKNDVTHREFSIDFSVYDRADRPAYLVSQARIPCIVSYHTDPISIFPHGDIEIRVLDDTSLRTLVR